jgi:fibronectin-binding autotransporter adhesin
MKSSDRLSVAVGINHSVRFSSPTQAHRIAGGVARCVVLAVAASWVDVASAQTGTWNVTTSGSWSNTANWLNGIVANGSSGTANFTNDITSDVTVTLDTARTLSAVVFGDSGTATAGSWTIGNGGTPANTLTLTSSPKITVNALGSGKSATISTNLVLGGNLDVTNSGTLNLSGAISGTGGNRALLFRNGTTNISGSSVTAEKFTAGFFASATVTWANAVGSLSGNWFGVGDGSGNSSFTMNSGSISLASNASQGLFVGSGATATFTMNGGAFTTTVGNLYLGAGLNGAGTGNGTMTLSGGTFAYSGAGTIVLGGTTGAAGTLNINGGVFATNGTTISKGAGTATVNLNGGMLRLSANSASIFGAGVNPVVGGSGAFVDTSTFTGTIATNLVAGAGSGGFTKSGAGSLTLAGTNAYVGPTTVSAGVLRATAPAALYGGTTSNWTAANINVASGATLTLAVGGSGFSSANIDTLVALGSATSGFRGGSAIGFDTSSVSSGTFTHAGNIANPNAGANALSISKTGAGTLELSGTLAATGNLAVQAGRLLYTGNQTASMAAVTVAGGTLAFAPSANASFTAANKLTVGFFAPGSLVVSSGSVGFSSNNYIILAEGANADISVTGGVLSFNPTTTNNVALGLSGAGLVTVSGGTFNLATNSNANVIVGGENLYAGNNASGVITVSGSGAVIVGGGSGQLILGQNRTSNGSSTGATGTLNLDGGIFQTARDITRGTSPTGTSSAFVNFNGGSLRAGKNSTTFLQGLTAATVTAGGAVVDTNGFDVTIGQVLEHDSALGAGLDGGLRKVGAGTLRLAGINTYNGTTQVDAGTLVVNGALASNVVVGSGAVLGGSGSLGNTLSGAGTISVGNSPGIATAAAVDPLAGTDWIFEITGTAPLWNSGTSASVNDVLRLTDATPFVNSLTAGSVVDVLFDLTSGGPVSQGTYLGGFFADQAEFNLSAALENGQFRYWVAGAYGLAGQQQAFNVGTGGAPVTYSQLSAYDPALSGSYSVTQRSVNFGAGSVSGSVTQFVIVPEPATSLAAVIGIALSIAGWAGRRRRAI